MPCASKMDHNMSEEKKTKIHIYISYKSVLCRHYKSLIVSVYTFSSRMLQNMSTFLYFDLTEGM